jgi:hypothetical protein
MCTEQRAPTVIAFKAAQQQGAHADREVHILYRQKPKEKQASPLRRWSAMATVPDLVDGAAKGIRVPGRFGAMCLPEGV